MAPKTKTNKGKQEERAHLEPSNSDARQSLPSYMFFYGDFMNPACLPRAVGLTEPPTYNPVTIRGFQKKDLDVVSDSSFPRDEQVNWIAIPGRLRPVPGACRL
ncbi:hypothetical protein P154DRAFT_569948 [Amniculicola lignicola CBS 123094]|uniref:Gamma-glutamylcyclotransferase AIG2-like domain-containing protein n=1 Tax=Amniculicola lignicola CBS 123094 TaxID=1392246 RepID=A0A6A5X196_9PLEO|nr:hypothetical protein P154DRAFT_569948 [Amniculicola lignicola CBS 123094]